MKRLIVPILLCAGIGATLLREIAFAAYFGTSPPLEVFRIAFSLPNMLGQGLAPAFIGAVLPLLVKAENRGQRAPFLRTLFKFNFLTTLAIALLGSLSASLQSQLLAPGFSPELQQELTQQIQLTWIFFLGLGLSFGLRTVLNHREVFWPGASTSLISGSVFALGVVALAAMGSDLNATSLSRLAIVAGGLILMVHVVVGRVDLQTAWFEKLSAPAQGIVVAVAMVLIYQALNTAPRFIDRGVASGFEQGYVAALEYSFNVLTVPGILLATSFITVFYPGFVKTVEQGGRPHRYMGLFFVTLLLAAIVGVLIFLFATNVVQLVYARGAFSQQSVTITADFLRWHGLGLPFMVTGIIVANGLMGYGKLRWLIGVGLAKVISKVAAIKLLVPVWGVSGLAISFVVVEAIAALLTLGLFTWAYKTRASSS